VLRLLTEAGVTFNHATRSPGARPADGQAAPRVVFFDSVDADVAREVRNLSRGGLDRVLAIATSSASFASADAWQLIAQGASDAFAWDHSHEPAVEVAERLKRWAQVEELVCSPVVQENLVGESPSWRRVLRQVVEVARWTESAMLITGESGTGKELTARLVHTLDTRRDKGSLVVVDCTTVVPTLSGSEFFGHERGAFTGAVSARDGAFALADGGTLFLDEIGELALPLQAELLRVIQEGTYKRVGSDTWRTTHFRLICATNQRLDEAQAAGNFRKDLYHRIAAWVCELPPLRNRPEDILPMAQHFLAKLCKGTQAPEFDPAVRQFLAARDYPGNARELRQVVHRLYTRHVGVGPITVGDIPEEERADRAMPPGESWEAALDSPVHQALAQGATLRQIGRAAQEAAIQLALSEERGSVRRAAQRLGVTDRALQMRRSAAHASAREAREGHGATTRLGQPAEDGSRSA
jgi:transcriptional regulator with GAF, ATPase, and Fis domain